MYRNPFSEKNTYLLSASCESFFLDLDVIVGSRVETNPFEDVSDVITNSNTAEDEGFLLMLSFMCC